MYKIRPPTKEIKNMVLLLILLMLIIDWSIYWNL